MEDLIRSSKTGVEDGRVPGGVTTENRANSMMSNLSWTGFGQESKSVA